MAEEAVMMMMMTTIIKGHQEAAQDATTTMMMIIREHLVEEVAARAVVRAGVGSEMKKDILKQPGKAGNNDVVVEEGVTMMIMTPKDLPAVVVEIPAAMTAEVGLVMKKVILKQRWKAGRIVVAEGDVTTTMKTTIIKELHVVEEDRHLMKAGVGMVMRKAIPVLQEKDGVIVIDVL